MNTHTLIHLIQSPEEVKESHLEMLEEETSHHPYFQAVRVLIAKAKGDSASIKKAAAYTADRTVLMQIINSEFNPDINLPNIDHLDIQKDDLNAFERLSGESGTATNEEEIADAPTEEVDDLSANLEKDHDFDDEFGDIDFDVPDYQVGFEEDALSDTAEKLEEDTSENITKVAPESTEEETNVNADLLANIEAARKSRQSFLEEEVAATDKEQALPKSADSDTSHNPYIVDEENEEVSDPDLLASLSALRKAKEDALQIKEQAEERIASMDEDIDETIEAIVKDEYPKNVEEEMDSINASEVATTTEDPLFEDPEYLSNPFDDSVNEKESEKNISPLQEAITDHQTIAKEEEDITNKTQKVNAESIEDFGIDTSLFGLDNWLEEEEEETEIQHSTERIKSLKASENTTTEAQNSQFEQYNSEEDGMTLEEKIKNQSSIISSFIENKTKIRPDKEAIESAENETDLFEESISQGSTFVSENLASIMVRQGKYQQAINIYKQLTLKYPDKKAYFADLIENLENK